LSIPLPYDQDLDGSGNITIGNGKLFPIATVWLGYEFYLQFIDTG